MQDSAPGVSGALARAVRDLAERTASASIERLWVFPPLRRGRRETGLIAAGCLVPGDRRLLVTLSYRSEESGEGISYESAYQVEGEAPSDRLPRVMEGVVRRMSEDPGAPEDYEIAGEPERLEELATRLESGLIRAEGAPPPPPTIGSEE